MKINMLRYILVLVPEVPGGAGPTKVYRACGLTLIDGDTLVSSVPHKIHVKILLVTF